MKSLFDILRFLECTVLPDGAADVLIDDLCLDSRKSTKGTLFCALKGEAFDGHAFITEAIDAGVSAVLCETLPNLGEAVTVPMRAIPHLYQKLGALADYFYDQPSSKLKIIGVTGTNGKTSTTHYLAQYLHLMGKKSAVIGTVGNGIWGHISETNCTTPDVLSLHKTLADFVAEQVEYVAMEVSSHALAQNRVDGVRFEAAIFTNLSRDHLDYHKDMQHYAEAKAKLFARSELRYAIVNEDDVYAPLMIRALHPAVRCVMVSPTKHEEVLDHYVFAHHVTHSDSVTSFQLYSPWGHFPVKINLIGEFNVANIMMSITALSVMGFPAEELANLSFFIQPVSGRMEPLRLPKLPLIIIDFAHTPDALEKALQSLQLYDKTIWLVFGCGGNRDAGKRPLMAKIAEYYADHVIVTEDNSRLEDIETIFAEIRKGFQYPDNIIFIEDRTDAILYALKEAVRGDIILLAGKGHETYLDKAGHKEHYDEREVVMKYFMAR